MIYLKLLKEWNKEDYYTRYNGMYGLYPVDISEKSINYIKNLFPNIVESEKFKEGYRYVIGGYGARDIPGNERSGGKYMDIFTRGFNRFRGDMVAHIGELVDDYYIVYIPGGFCYKCDQLDGIKELFIDRGII